MQMTAPHGPHCNSQTFPANCKDCGEPIYVFTCDCGSAVLFEDLGQPWPKHDCRGHRFPSKDFAIEDNYGVQLRKAPKNRTNSRAIRSVDARDESDYRGRGVVREVYEDVDVFEKIGLDGPTKFAEAALGDLARSSLTQITVHVEDQGASEFQSYTFLCKQSLARKLNIGRDDFLDLRLESVSVPGGTNLWRATQVEQLDI